MRKQAVAKCKGPMLKSKEGTYFSLGTNGTDGRCFTHQSTQYHLFMKILYRGIQEELGNRK